MTIEINAVCVFKKEFGGKSKEIMSGFIHNRTINDFDFNKYVREFYAELKSNNAYDIVRIDSIEIKSWDLAHSTK